MGNKTKCQIGLPHTHANGQRMYEFEITNCSLISSCAGACKKKFDPYSHELVLRENSWIQGARGNEHEGSRHWCRECSKDAIEWERHDNRIKAEARLKQYLINKQRSDIQKAVAKGDFDAYYDEDAGYFILTINPPITII